MNLESFLTEREETGTIFQPEHITIEEGAIEEEQAAPIQTVSATTATMYQQQQQQQQQALPQIQLSRSEASTPQRKISTSSRFMNAFQQFYTTATNTSSSAPVSVDNNISESTLLTATSPAEETMPSNTTTAIYNRTPTKNMESKLLSMWHNVKYGWSGKLRTNFSKEQPVWLLGRCYHRRCTPPSSMESSAEFQTNNLTDNLINQTSLPNNISLYPQIDEIIVPQELAKDATDNQTMDSPWEEGIEGFKRDFFSRIWLTYRREFPTMNGSNYTSDCGWGCMLRSGQMLLAQALVCHFLGRSWRFDADTQLHSTFEDTLHKKIVKWFGDSSSKGTPFSIHALVSLGEQLGKKAGDWYGPASVSYLLKHALKNAALEIADFDNLTIYVAKNCTIYLGDIEDECAPSMPTTKLVPWQTPKSTPKTQMLTTNKINHSNWKALIILIPLRLGAEKLNPVYAHCLKLLLSTEYCIGIIGGRPRHSLYFVGFQEDKLIHLDPHYCQDNIDVKNENFPLQSFHCKSPRKLKMNKMDPSCCIGFYCATKTDFDNFQESVQMYLNPLRCASGTIERVIPASQQMPVQQYAESLNQMGLNGGNSMELNCPLFTFSRGRCEDHETNLMSDSYYKPAVFSTQDREKDNDDETEFETEEFVLL